MTTGGRNENDKPQMPEKGTKRRRRKNMNHKIIFCVFICTTNKIARDNL
jgi:hypothetical protein